MKTYEIDGTKVTVQKSSYMDNQTLAIVLTEVDTGESYDVITTNINDSDFVCDKTHAFVDTNNCPWAPKFIKDNNLGKPMNYIGESGYCSYPLYEFNVEDIPDL